MWTTFWDMHSGGGQKLDWDKIYIEAPRDRAMEIFEATFGRHPENVTCDCCGEDYSIDTDETLEKATEYHRHGQTLAEYLASGKGKVIYSQSDRGAE